MPGRWSKDRWSQAAGRQRAGTRAALGTRRRRRRVPLRRLPRLRPAPIPMCCRCRSSPTAARSCAPIATARVPCCSTAAVRRRRQPRRVGADQEQGRRGAQRHARSGRHLRDRPQSRRRALAVEQPQAEARAAPAGARGDHARALAARDRPHVLAQPEPRHQRLPGKGNLGLLAGPLFADRSYHQYFYGVAPEFATASRPAYERAGRLRGMACDDGLLAPLRRRLAGRVRPLRRPARCGVCSEPAGARNHGVTAGFGISWIFATSSQRVLTSD